MSAVQIDRGSVKLTVAAAAQAPLIQNLMQLYTHDFSEFWAGTSRGDLNAEGRFDPYPLDDYWRRASWSAQLIWCDTALAGFSLINDATHSGVAAQRNMGEFFILRKYRGRGVGGIAAELIFSQHAGSWEVAVTRKNARALAFWRKTINSSRNASDIQETDLQNAQWNGSILRFDWSVSMGER
jgi:predicted acetyltransferase